MNCYVYIQTNCNSNYEFAAYNELQYIVIDMIYVLVLELIELVLTVTRRDDEICLFEVAS